MTHSAISCNRTGQKSCIRIWQCFFFCLVARDRCLGLLAAGDLQNIHSWSQLQDWKRWFGQFPQKTSENMSWANMTACWLFLAKQWQALKKTECRVQCNLRTSDTRWVCPQSRHPPKACLHFAKQIESKLICWIVLYNMWKNEKDLVRAISIFRLISRTSECTEYVWQISATTALGLFANQTRWPVKRSAIVLCESRCPLSLSVGQSPPKSSNKQAWTLQFHPSLWTLWHWKWHWNTGCISGLEQKQILAIVRIVPTIYSWKRISSNMDKQPQTIYKVDKRDQNSPCWLAICRHGGYLSKSNGKFVKIFSLKTTTSFASRRFL